MCLVGIAGGRQFRERGMEIVGFAVFADYKDRLPQLERGLQLLVSKVQGGSAFSKVAQTSSALHGEKEAREGSLQRWRGRAVEGLKMTAYSMWYGPARKSRPEAFYALVAVLTAGVAMAGYRAVRKPGAFNGKAEAEKLPEAVAQEQSEVQTDAANATPERKASCRPSTKVERGGLSRKRFLLLFAAVSLLLPTAGVSKSRPLMAQGDVLG
eukprot:763100-Hanusia_phi.AAC.21